MELSWQKRLKNSGFAMVYQGLSHMKLSPPTIPEGLPPSLVFWEFPFLTSHNFGRQYEIHVIQSFPHLLLRNWGFREWGGAPELFWPPVEQTLDFSFASSMGGSLGPPR